MPRCCRFGLLAAVATCLGGSAQAAEPPVAAPAEQAAPAEPTPPGPGSLIDAPPPPPPREARLHDGFFVRLGLGFARTSLEYSGGATLGGFGGAFDLTVGAAVRPGIVLALAASANRYVNATFNHQGGASSETADARLNTLGVTFLVDRYPNPRGGLHFGGEFGLAGALIRNDEVGPTSDLPYGVSVGAHIGYDIWISDRWSFGGLFKLNYLSLFQDQVRTETEVRAAYGVTGFQPRLLAVFTYN